MVNKIFRYKFLIATVIWLLAIAYASFIPMDMESDGVFFFEGEDKLIHFIMYSGLITLCILTFRIEKFFFKNFVTILTFGIVLAIGTEIIQSFIPGRSASWSDLLANLSGILIGYLGSKWVVNKIIAD